MNTSLVPIDPAILVIMRGGPAGMTLPMPFGRELMLLDCHVAGTGYIEDMEDIAVDLAVGAPLALRREPANSHDTLAILVFDERGRKLGYVPRAKNEVLSRLLDAGKLIYGRITHLEWSDDWLRIEMRVYMREM
jgi:hypothetical protein